MKKIIILLILACVGYFVGDAVMTQVNKKSAKSTRLACHKTTTVFERTYKPDMIAHIQNAIKAGSATLDIKLQPSVYMKSTLFDTLSKEDVQKVFEQTLKKHTTTQKTTPIAVHLLVYENDKKDPGKKTKAATLYEGYIVLSFLVDGELIYKVQVDFLKPKAADLADKMECGILSLLNL